VRQRSGNASAYDPTMTAIAGVHGVLAPHGYPQDEITAAFGAVVSPDGAHRAVVERIHQATGVQHRNLALPLADYALLDGFGQANDAFIRVGLDLAEAAIAGALDAAGLAAADVDLILSTSVTGIAAPSLEARLALRMGFRPDVKRLPVFGLGCVAGASGIARLHDHLLGSPDGVAVLVSVELCSLTVQRDDVSMPNIVASGLFGDGAAAVVMVGSRRAESMGITGPLVLDSRSRIYPDSERTMGWDISESGFRIVLSAGVPDVITTYVGDDVTDFLVDHDLKPSDIARWVCPSRRATSAGGHAGRPRPARRPARRDLALARVDRQPVVVVRAARPRRHARRSRRDRTAGARNTGTDARDGPGVLRRTGAAAVVTP
jgi:alkylresorcinol/alkylpyrone synthase